MSGSHAGPREAVAIAAGCPPDDTISAHVAGKLDDDERERVTRHLDECESCRDLVIHALRWAKQDAAATQSDPAPVPAPPGALPGVLAGRYELKKLIGSGGMGSVYEALDLTLHRLVALKVLRLAPHLAAERADGVNRLVREARAMAVLSHKHVVVVYDVGFHGDHVFVAMQLVDGLTLRAWLAAAPRSTTEILRVLFDAGHGLAAAHASRLVHRDFKPDNVLISHRGTARVTDFGLARRTDLRPDTTIITDRISTPRVIDVEDVASVTRSGAVVGTPAYMAPEQAKGDPCDARADQFSFCATAWEALYGARPFAGTTWAEIHVNVVHQRYAPSIAPDRVPRAIQRALERGLLVDPAARFPSMLALLEVFEDTLQRPIRRRRIAFVLAAVAAVVIAVFVTRTVPDDREPEAPRVAAVRPPGSAASATPADPAPPAALTRPAGDATRAGGTSARDATRAGGARNATSAGDATRARSGDHTTARAGSAPPARDPRLDELAAGRHGIDAVWRGRDLLRADLPDGFAAALRDADAALDAGDADRAAAALDVARAAIERVAIDRAFVDRKLQRLNAGLARVPADRKAELSALLRTVIERADRDDHAGANRTLNEIAKRLGMDR